MMGLRLKKPLRHYRGGLVLLLMVAVTLTAPLAQAAPWSAPQGGGVLRIGYLGMAGSAAANGAQLAVDQINGAGGFTAADGNVYRLELIMLAAAPTAETLGNNITAMVAQNIVAFLGPDSSAALTPDNVQALINTGLPVLTGATGDALTTDDAADVLFRIQAPSLVFSRALATYLVNDLGITSIALVSTDVESSEALRDFEKTMTDLGIVAAGKVQLANASFLESQGQGLLNLNPEAVAMWGPAEDAVALLRQLRNGGWTGRFVYPHAEEAAQTKTLPDDLADGVLGVTGWSYAYTNQASRVFLEDYITTFGTVPGTLSAAAYDAVWALRSTMVNAGVDADAIRTGLLQIAPLDLIQGTVRPADFGNGDLSRMAAVYVLGPGGGPTVVALFDDTQRLQLVNAGG